MTQPIQRFTKEYLEYCRSIKPEAIIEFLEGYRNLLAGLKTKSQTCRVPHQTRIKKLRKEWPGAHRK